jgi:phosphatidylethanolamine/phosphatidyl-N-methylethanolamine N-methyltransferase
MNDDEYGSSELYYSKFYDQTICERGIGAKAVRQTHIELERGLPDYFHRVLEIGAGTGQHLNFVKHEFEEYHCLDTREDKIQFTSKGPSIVQHVANAEDLPFEEGYFDRVLSMCVLHHVEKPESVVSELNRVLAKGGMATIYLSCDPSVLVRLIRNITVARAAKKLGFQGYSLLIAREHRNQFHSLDRILRHVFRDHKMKIKYYPFRIRSWNLNTFVIYQITKL